MKFSKKGYLSNSSDVNKPQNIIKGGNITMKGVDFKVHGIDNNGYAKVMTPGYDAIFPNAEHVTETPIKNKNMGSFKLRQGKGNMPKTGRSIPLQMTGPLHQEEQQVNVETGSRNLNRRNVREDRNKIINAVVNQDANVNFYPKSGRGTKVKFNKGNTLVSYSNQKGGLVLDSQATVSDKDLSNTNKRKLKRELRKTQRNLGPNQGISIKDGKVSTYTVTRPKTEREKNSEKRKAELEAKRQARLAEQQKNRDSKKQFKRKTKEEQIALRNQKINELKNKKEAEINKRKDEKSGN